MLSTTQYIVVEGESTVDEKKIATFRAVINPENPKNVRFSTVKHDEDSYKSARDIVRGDEAEFEDYVYQMQDDMLSAVNE